MIICPKCSRPLLEKCICGYSWDEKLKIYLRLVRRRLNFLKAIRNGYIPRFRVGRKLFTTNVTWLSDYLVSLEFKFQVTNPKSSLKITLLDARGKPVITFNLKKLGFKALKDEIITFTYTLGIPEDEDKEE